MHMRHNGASRTLLPLIDGVTTVKLKHKKPCTVQGSTQGGLPYL